MNKNLSDKNVEPTIQSVTGKKKVALALSSGGPRGFAYIGAIEELLSRGYEITSVAGSSAGSLVGGIFAAGGLEAFKEWLCKLDPMQVVTLMDFSFSKNYLVKGDRVINAIKKRVPEVNIEDLPIPFTAVATDLHTGEEVVFREGPLFQAIRASISIPSMFRPVRWKGRTLIDGGMVNTMPLNRFLRCTGRGQDAALADRLSYNKVLVFNLGFEKKSEFKEHWIYVPEPEANYYRIGFYDNILGTDRLSMYIEIGYPKNAEIRVDEQLALTLQNLRRHGVVAPDNALVAYEPIIMDPGYVHINTEHEREIRALKTELKSLGAYTIGRYGGWTYCSMEDCMLEAEDIAQTL